MSVPATVRGRRWRGLVAALVPLAVGIVGEPVELPTLLHGLSLVVVVASLAALSKVVPALAAGDP